MSSEKQTPLMQQYFRIREQYPDALLLFQVGDFYELFFDDAKEAAGFLAIALTKRGKNAGQDIPLCGIPVHALNHYLVKLIKGGYKVAICDQITEPKPGTVVERAVTRVLTPGTLTESSMLDAHSASYLFSLFPGQDGWGLLFGELLTAQLFATSVPAGEYRLLESELVRFLPDEIIVPSNTPVPQLYSYLRGLGYVVSPTPFDMAGQPIARAWIESQFASSLSLLNEKKPVEHSLALFHNYLAKNQESSLSQFKQIQLYEPDDYLVLDASTQKNLEIVGNSRDGGRKNTLLSVLDGARTAMGSRTIKKWLLRPLVQKNAIIQRQEAVGLFASNLTLMHQLEEELGSLCDLERIVGRIGLNRALIHDYCALREALRLVPRIHELLTSFEHISLIKNINTKLLPQPSVPTPLRSSSYAGQGDRLPGVATGRSLEGFGPLLSLLIASIPDTPNEGMLIKPGFDHNLDRLRELAHNGKQALLDLERREVERTGINSLKVGYSQITGYYIEITNPNLAKVPADYIPEQSLSNRKRFTTPELKSLENDLLKAQTQIDAIEKEVFERVKQEVATYLSSLRQMAQALAYLDALFGFARVAYNYRYVQPQFVDSQDITITAGRHPVVEQSIGSGFIPNNTHLTDQESLWIITGPNMGGKSTYLRQVALISIMAQCGSFVPAQSAHLPLLDRVFTRIGAGDDVAQGKSTFLVEMEETAVICAQATPRSLVILDEVGRGTSTYDGMAIAQALIEYLYQSVQARCLFATHYHELTTLSDQFSGISNYYMKSTKTKDGILFLHELCPGVAQGSFGIEVAKLAQLPKEVVERAEVILKSLSSFDTIPQHSASESFCAHPECFAKQNVSKDYAQHITNLQSRITTLESKLRQQQELLAAFDQINYDDLSPKKAFDLLWDMKKRG